MLKDDLNLLGDIILEVMYAGSQGQHYLAILVIGVLRGAHLNDKLEGRHAIVK